MMKSKLLGAIATALVLFSSAASSTVIYQFSFSNLVGVTAGTGADFDITLTYPTYVTTTGMNLLPDGAHTDSLASLGYSVAYAGTDNLGVWGFDDDTGSVLIDGVFSFGGNSFLFIPNPLHGDYFSAPGTFTGSVSGNADFVFSGTAVLTIREDNTVPEPAPLALLALGLAGLVATRRRKS